MGKVKLSRKIIVILMGSKALNAGLQSTLETVDQLEPGEGGLGNHPEVEFPAL